MIESLFVTLLPLGFLVVLFGGGARFRRQNVDMDGDPPIGKVQFLSSKYLIVAVWAAMVAQCWGRDLSFLRARGSLRVMDYSESAGTRCIWVSMQPCSRQCYSR
jgi:hypothetical protein